MASLAATATTSAAVPGALVLIVAAITAGYALACWLRPFTRCRRCSGTGARRSAILHILRTCRRCDGNGRHLRTGRRVINSVRELHDKGTNGGTR